MSEGNHLHDQRENLSERHNFSKELLGHLTLEVHPVETFHMTAFDQRTSLNEYPLVNNTTLNLT